MATEWPTTTIEEIAEKVAMGPFGSSIKVETFVPNGIPIISGQHLHGIRVSDAPGFNFITNEHGQRLANANVRRGDIIFTHAGNIGQAAYIPKTQSSPATSFRSVSSICAATVQSLFLSSSPCTSSHPKDSTSSSPFIPSWRSIDCSTRHVFAHNRASLPPLAEQRAIAHILGTLDDKIELNRRMNETLEAMARALFKDWFVDFADPRQDRGPRSLPHTGNLGSVSRPAG